MKPFAPLALLACLFVVGCGSTDSDPADTIQPITKQGTAGMFEMTVTPKAQVAQGDNTLGLHLREVASGADVAGATCTAGLSMPSMGMDSPGARVEEVGSGDYTVMSVNCSMAGDWQLALHCEASGMADDAAFDFDVQ